MELQPDMLQATQQLMTTDQSTSSRQLEMIQLQKKKTEIAYCIGIQ